MLGGQPGGFRQDDVQHPAPVVDAFETVDDRASHQRDASAVGRDLPVGVDAADRHRQVQLDHVSGLPSPADGRIALGQGGHPDRLPVDLERGPGSRRAAEAVQRTRQRGNARPAGNAKRQVERAPLAW